jgi:hypothetical protein
VLGVVDDIGAAGGVSLGSGGLLFDECVFLELFIDAKLMDAAAVAKTRIKEG